MDNELVLCLLTYNRPEIINIFLEKEIEILYRAKVDLIIYDSSETQLTERIVDDFKRKNYDNLFYEKVNSKISSNQKFFEVASKIDSKYQYVWISHDHTIFNEPALKYIKESLIKRPDFIYIRKQCKDYNCVIEHNLNEFAIKAAWQLGRFGSAIIRNETFLKKVNWERISEKYLDDRKINFSQIGLYLEQLSRISEPYILTLEFPREAFYDLFRFQKASWDNETIRICLESWGSVITSLPDEVYDKKTILQTIDKYFLSRNKIIELKSRHLYNLKMFFKYRKWIKLIIPEGYKNFFIVAFFPDKILRKIYFKKVKHQISQLRKDGYKICIFGAGKHGIEFTEYLQDNKVLIDAILVTNTYGNPTEIHSIPVIKVSTFVPCNKTFVFICVGSEYQGEVIEKLNRFDKCKYQILTY